jgi:putative molybdenum carrier protein
LTLSHHVLSNHARLGQTTVISATGGFAAIENDSPWSRRKAIDKMALMAGTHLLHRVISGGQTGADQAGWKAAQTTGIPTGGAMPRGFRTEEGPRPEFAELYGAHELGTDSYPARTDANVHDSDGTLWFGHTDSPGGRQTLQACRAGD